MRVARGDSHEAGRRTEQQHGTQLTEGTARWPRCATCCNTQCAHLSTPWQHFKFGVIPLDKALQSANRATPWTTTLPAARLTAGVRYRVTLLPPWCLTQLVTYHQLVRVELNVVPSAGRVSVALLGDAMPPVSFAIPRCPAWAPCVTLDDDAPVALHATKVQVQQVSLSGAGWRCNGAMPHSPRRGGC